MKSWPKFKSIIDESSPQAKIFDSLCHNHTEKLMKSWKKLKCWRTARRRRNFFRDCHNSTHIINEIVNEIEKQDRRKLAAGENFCSLCHNRTHIINEIANEIEKQDWWKLAHFEISTLCFFEIQDCEPPSGGILIFRTGVLQNLRGAIYPRRGEDVEISLLFYDL